MKVLRRNRKEFSLGKMKGEWLEDDYRGRVVDHAEPFQAAYGLLPFVQRSCEALSADG